MDSLIALSIAIISDFAVLNSSDFTEEQASAFVTACLFVWTETLKSKRPVI